VGRVLSTRRFIFVYALGSALLLVLSGNAWHRHQLHRAQATTRAGLEALQHLMTAAYRELPEERFSLWLGSANLRAWAPVGWDVFWIAPGPVIRWSLRQDDSAALPAEVLEALQALAQSPDAPASFSCPKSPRVPSLLSAFHLSPEKTEAGQVVLRAPLATAAPGSATLGLAFLLLAALVAGGALLFRCLFLRNLHSVFHTVDFPAFPCFASDAAVRSWARNYIQMADDKIAHIRQMFDRLLDGLEDGTMLVDANNRIRRANQVAAGLLGEKPEDLKGRCLADMPDRDILEHLVGEIRASQLYQADEIQLRSNAVVCTVAGVAVQYPQGPGPAEVILVLRDLTRVRQLERAGEEYAVNVSHELKTPLTLILGYTETLLSHADMAPEFRERSLRTIERHAKRIIRIVDDLLRLAWLRNEADTVGIPRAMVSVNSVIEEVVASCREWARSAGLTIATHVPENLMWSLNSGLMEEALVNLVKNAILYALVGPIEIRARVCENGNLELAVMDRGPGLKLEDANRIFDRFYRAEKSRSRASGGSGLGLPIVQQIVDGHHGTARVESALGEGCTFLLEIPPE